jgi:hypothetical protein
MRSVLERKLRLDGSVQEWRCDLLALEPGRYAAVRYVLPEERALAGTDLVLPAGTVTIGHYWADRPYTAYHWLTGELTLAVYCSVAELLEVGAELIAYRDLAVDLLIRPTGSCEVLDEHELPAGSPDAAAVARVLAGLRADPSALLVEIEIATRKALAARL